MHPSYAVINLSNLKYNFLNIRKKIKDTKIMAVVKADAYGHGMIECAALLESLGKNKPEYFSVAFPNEGRQLREAKINQPILIFEPFTKDQVHLLFKYNLIATVFSLDHLRILDWGLKQIGNKNKILPKIKIHIKVDTGMNRLGIGTKEAIDFIYQLKKKIFLIIDGIYTHFACADETDKTFTRLQLKRFEDILKELKKINITYGLAHAANSGAILDVPNSYLDMVRPGISLYGYYPSLETSKSIKLKPVMSLYSKVASAKQIKKGDTVSYGRKYTAKRKTKIVSIPLGYADGIARGLSNKMEVLIKGKKYKQVGIVTMDRVMINVKNDDIKVGDKVIMFGNVKNNYISVWDWCKAIDTIPYEITCNISNRIPRIYKR
ncbi:MAG: alanine racemase [Bacteroidetes bacterium]|nr:alanine racemase [Bacteroidota bacterium]MCH8941944.1 alanine racemase [Bacteroidota bacterium]